MHRLSNPRTASSIMPCGRTVAVLFVSGTWLATLLAGSGAFGLRAADQVTIMTTAETVTAEQKAFFEQEIEPVLRDSCWRCHGEKKQASGLRLDSRQAFLDGGENGPTIVLGKPDDSLLFKVLAYDGDIQMPPDSKLDSDKIDALRKWVEQNAPWPAAKAEGKRKLQADGFSVGSDD